MATVTQVVRTCDVCGATKDIQTWAFGLDGKAYEIDLCPKDSKDLSKIKAEYVPKARKATAAQNQRRGGRKRPSGAENGRPQRSGSRKPRSAAEKSRSLQHDGHKRPSGAESSRSQQSDGRKPRSGAQSSRSQGRKSQEPRSGAESTRSQGRAAPETGIYVYGILPADIDVAAEMAGVEERPLRAVRSDGLAALVSEVDLSRRGWSQDDVRTHREILDATATAVPVLPLRFGIVLTDEDAVAEKLLAAHHDEFATALDQLEGRAEFLVKGRYVEKDAAASREEDTQAVQEAMEGVSVASIVRKPADEMDAVHVAFLVAVDDESEVERVIDDLAGEWAGRIEVQLLGPVAAYDFVGDVTPEG